MGRFKIAWDDPFDKPEVPPATQAQLDYLVGLVSRYGYEPEGYDPENLNIRDASDMIEEMLGNG